VDPSQGTVEVRFVVPEPPAYLLADMTVSINVDVGRRDSALMIPRDLVREVTSGKPWVVVAVDGRAVRRDVRIGLLGDREVEVVDGLAAGERVLRADTEPGTRVRLRP
jgi:HlyD family secretion protein